MSEAVAIYFSGGILMYTHDYYIRPTTKECSVAYGRLMGQDFDYETLLKITSRAWIGEAVAFGYRWSVALLNDVPEINFHAKEFLMKKPGGTLSFDEVVGRVCMYREVTENKVMSIVKKIQRDKADPKVKEWTYGMRVAIEHTMPMPTPPPGVCVAKSRGIMGDSALVLLMQNQDDLNKIPNVKEAKELFGEPSMWDMIDKDEEIERLKEEDIKQRYMFKRRAQIKDEDEEEEVMAKEKKKKKKDKDEKKEKKKGPPRRHLDYGPDSYVALGPQDDKPKKKKGPPRRHIPWEGPIPDNSDEKKSKST